LLQDEVVKKQIVIYGRDPIVSSFAQRMSRKLGWLVDGNYGRSDRIEHRRDRQRIRPGIRAVLFLARRHRADLIVVRSLRDIEMTPCIVRRLIHSLARRRSGIVALAENLDTSTASAAEVEAVLQALAAWGRTEGWRIGCERAMRLGICGRPFLDVDPYQIIRLLRDGYSAQETGEKLGVSAATVRHRVELFGSEEDIALTRRQPRGKSPALLHAHEGEDLLRRFVSSLGRGRQAVST
jgi:DNA invertase Pin-like site-specific DNA recombinase